MNTAWSTQNKVLAYPGTNKPLFVGSEELKNIPFEVNNNLINFLDEQGHQLNGSISQLEYWESEKPELRPACHVVQKMFAEQRFRYLEKVIDFKEINNALDVGCGNGVGTLSLKNRVETVFGLDMSMFLLNQMPDNIFGMRGDATKLPFLDKSLDFSMAWELLHHIPDPLPVFVELKRITKKWVVIFEPNRLNPLQAAFSSIVTKERLGLRNSRSYLQSLADKAGLKTAHYSTVGCIFPNKYPLWLAKFGSILPFRLPYIGISHLMVFEVN